MSKLNSYIAKIIRSPRTIRNIINKYWWFILRYFLYNKSIKNIKSKECLNVVFFVTFHTTWKLESLYRLMKEDKLFNPIILACPVVNNGPEYMKSNILMVYNYFKNNDYNIYKAYDEELDTYIDVKKDLKPDIIFYTNPYQGLVDDRYYITRYKDILGCYVSYAYNNIAAPYTYNLLFHDYLWKFYLENDNMVDFYNNKLKFPRKSHCAVGYPSFDLFNKDISYKKDDRYKYIIWAPHHTLDTAFGVLHRDSFISYSAFMLELLEKYSDKVFFIFRPHPLLKTKLYNHPDWGIEKTNSYYNQWESHENSLLSENRDYIEDFILSDSIIHDSGSFTVEYLYTLKPALFLGERPNIDDLTPTANEAFNCYEYATNNSDIENFIIKVLTDSHDVMYEKKLSFKENFLDIHKCKSVAENIMNDIKHTIKK